MRYRLDNSKEIEQAREYLNQLIRLNANVDIKRSQTNRTLSQNAFFYLLVTYFGGQVGYYPNEAKIYVKRHMKDIFAYKKNGEYFMRSTADLSKEEMRQVLDRLYILAGEQGVELPLAENADWLNQIANEAEKSGFYL